MILLCADTLRCSFCAIKLKVDQQGSSSTCCSSSFVTGWRGQERGGAIVGNGPFEPHSSDEGQHVSLASSLWWQLLLVLAGGWRRLGLVVGTVAQTRGLEVLLEQILFLLLVQLLLIVLLLLILIMVMLQLLGLLIQ